MKTIYKYPLPQELNFTLDLPAGAKVLTVQAQAGVPCMWVLLDPEVVITRLRRFQCVGTGFGPDTAGDYVGTFQLDGGALVFHLFECPE